MNSLDTRVCDSSLYTRGWDDGEICINIVYVHYYLLIICGGKEMENINPLYSQNFMKRFLICCDGF